MEAHFPPAVQEHLADEARFSEMAANDTDEERRVAMSHIEEGFLQAERGELINGDQARQQIQELKSRWLRGRAPGLPPNPVE